MSEKVPTNHAPTLVDKKNTLKASKQQGLNGVESEKRAKKFTLV